MAALYLGSVAVHLVLSSRMAGPVIQGDEGAYMGTARFLATGVGILFRQSPYQPGWGALLFPVERTTADPTILYRAALVLNALALGSLVVVAYALSRWLIDPRAIGRRMAAAAVVAAYPAYLAYSNVALETSVFVPLCALTAWAVARCAERPTWRRWAVAGVLAGGCYGVHALGTIVVAAVLALAILARRPLHERLPGLVGCLAGIQVSALPSLLLLRRVIDYDRRITATPAVRVVSRAQAVIGLYNHNATLRGHAVLLAYEAAGQVWYLTAATAGLVVVGALVAAVAMWRVFVRRSRRPADFVAAFAGLLFGLGLFSSANRFIVGRQGTGQADALIYGRYNEHLLAPLLAVAAASLLRRRIRWRQVSAWSAAVLAVLAACGGLLVVGRSAAALRSPIVFVNGFGLQPALHRAGRPISSPPS
ncbi:MAG TPA: glycosyltransferase family 39 protein, partial [Acidimicrobiales bacterium]